MYKLYISPLNLFTLKKMEIKIIITLYNIFPTKNDLCLFVCFLIILSRVLLTTFLKLKSFRFHHPASMRHKHF